MHVKIYDDRNSKPQQEHCLEAVSKTLLGVGLKLFYVALSSAVVYTRHLFSPREDY